MAQVDQTPIELDSSVSRRDSQTTNISNIEIEQPPLPPTDTGKAAWLVLAGCSLIQAPVWGNSSNFQCLYTSTESITGFQLAFGVFQEYYSSHPEALGGNDNDTSNVAVIGTTISVRDTHMPTHYLVD